MPERWCRDLIVTFVIFSRPSPCARMRRWQQQSIGTSGVQKNSAEPDDELKPTLIAGVPVYNYHRAFESNGQGTSLLHVARGREIVWNIFFHSNITDASIDAVCDQVGDACKFKGSAKGVPVVAIEGSVDALQEALKRDQDKVEFVEPELPLGEIPEVPEVEAEVDKLGEVPWGLRRVGVPQSILRGKGVHIYIVDTGVRTTHEDFGGRAIPSLYMRWSEHWRGRYYQVTECEKTDTACALDFDGHGTHCAGVAGGTSYGVAPEATLHAVKVMDDRTSGSSLSMVAALNSIVARGLRPAVVSMSLGRKGRSKAEKEAIDATTRAGVTVVVAAGNEGSDARAYTPANIKSAITVGAIDHHDQRAEYSNYGSSVDIFAPGSSIRSAISTSDIDVKVYSGTSMACPLVAGAVALILEAYPHATPEQVRTHLLNVAEKGSILDLMPEDPDFLLQVRSPSNETDWSVSHTKTPLGATCRKQDTGAIAEEPDEFGDCACPDTHNCQNGYYPCQSSRILDTSEGTGWFIASCTKCKCVKRRERRRKVD